MARTKISEFSATAADNTDIDNINIAEGCAPSGINNAIRELMAQLKDMQTGASGDTFTLTTVNSTTVDTTNLEATNLKAKDGTAAGSIADSTGVVTLASTVLTTTDINGGTVDGTTIGATTPSTVVATQVDITAQGDLRLQDTTGGQFVALQAPGTIATSYTLTLPVDDGTSGQALITDGSGVLSWSTAASGDVYGPASATDNAVARYDGTTGKIIQNSAVTIADDGATVIAANSTSDGLRITQVGTGNALMVEDSANPDSTPVVIDSEGKTIVGQTTPVQARNNFSGLIQSPAFSVGGDASASAHSALGIYANGNTSPIVSFVKGRGTFASKAVVISGDFLGRLSFQGYDGTTQIEGAAIFSEVDGTPGTNDMPGRLVFATTADGASSPTERMRIDNAGKVGIGGAPGATNRVRLVGTSTGNTTQYGFLNELTAASDVTGLSAGFTTSLATQAASFTLVDISHYRAGFLTVGAGSTVTNQYGFNATSSITGATNNYGFYSNIASGTGRWNFYANGTAANVFAGTTSIGGTVGAESLRVTPVASAVNYVEVLGGAAGGAARIFARGSDTNIPIVYSSKGNREHAFYTNGDSFAQQFAISHTASAVNYLQATGSATGNNVSFSAAGTDANIGIDFSSKGFGSLRFFTGGNRQFNIADTASAVNYLQVTGGATGVAATLSAAGSDTNIDLALTPKGTGVLRFGTYTAGILAQTGYITVKDAAGNTRNLLVG
jgi:hypothetical protein